MNNLLQMLFQQPKLEESSVLSSVKSKSLIDIQVKAD